MKVIKLKANLPYMGEEVLIIPFKKGKKDEVIKDYIAHIKEGNYLDNKDIEIKSSKISNVKKGHIMECINCGNLILKEHSFGGNFYDTPWDKKPNPDVRFCSQLCENAYYGNIYSKDFAYFTCISCGRTICQQNPGNGWHIQYREVYDELVCLKCYQEDILKNGIPIEKFEKGVISGMFFSFGNEEVFNAGYAEVPGYVNIKIEDQETVDRYCNKAIELIKNGYKVVTAYESMAYGGSEGYVTMFCKKEEQ